MISRSGGSASLVRLLRSSVGLVTASLFPQSGAFAAPRLTVDPTALSDDSLSLSPSLDYDPSAFEDIGSGPGLVTSDPPAQFVSTASPEPDLSAPGTGPAILALAPTVSGEQQNSIFAVERNDSGDFAVTAADLRSARIKVPPGTADTAYVPLSSLPGLVAKYDEPNQTIDLDVPDALRDPLVVKVAEQRVVTDLANLRSTRNIQLNYRLLGAKSLSGGGRDSFGGDVLLVASDRFTQFVSTANFGTDRSFSRGDSVLRVEDPRKVRTYALGDIVTGTLGTSNSVRLGGVQIQSNFQQRPDIFRGPLPQFAGTAAVPSTVDLFVDSLKIFNTKVPRGPFLLQSLPLISGRTLSVVTQDQDGREIRITRPLFSAPGLLRKGLSEYSAEVGFPRLGGVSTFGRYLDFVAASGTLRYGLSDRLTIEGNAEVGGGLLNGGFGISAALGYLGSLNASVAVSDFRGRNGARVSADYQLGFGGINGFYSLVREFGTFRTLADVTAIRSFSLPRGGMSMSQFNQKDSIDRAGLFFQLPFDPTTVDLSYNRIKLGGFTTRTVSAGFTRRINSRLSVNGNALMDLENSNAVAARITFNLRLGKFANVAFGGDRSRGVSNYSVTLNGFNAGRQNRLGYTLRQQGNDDGDAFRSARLEYRLPQALIVGNIDQTRGNARVQLGMEGALLLADGDVFAVNRIGESFALVKNAGPGADILQNGRRIARSNKSGNALLPELEAFSETRISLDPTQLPEDLEALNGTEFNVVTPRRNGAVVDFGVQKVFAGIVVLVDKNGKPFPPGTQVFREGMEPEIVGYDGETFLRGLKPENVVVIDMGEAGKCTGRFSYTADSIAQPKIGPVTCE